MHKVTGGGSNPRRYLPKERAPDCKKSLDFQRVVAVILMS
jgi:hypothetical protein